MEQNIHISYKSMWTQMREIDEYNKSFFTEALAEYLTIFIFLIFVLAICNVQYFCMK